MAYNGAAFRNSPIAAVVVGYHNIHSKLTAAVYLAVCLYAVVHGYDNVNAFFLQPLYCAYAQAVALLMAGGYAVYHIRPHGAEAVCKYGCGGYAVRIIIAEYAYPFSADSGSYPFRRNVHILKVIRIAKLSLSGMEKLLHLLGCFSPPGIQKRP